MWRGIVRFFGGTPATSSPSPNPTNDRLESHLNVHPNHEMRHMYQADIAKLEEAVTSLQTTLRNGLLAVDIWDRTMGLSLASYNSIPVAVALFNDITTEINGFMTRPGGKLAALIASRHGESAAATHTMIVDLTDDRMLVIVTFGERLACGALLDKKSVNLGVVTAMALPRLIQQVQDAESH